MSILAAHLYRRLRQPEHKVLQQLRHRGDNVFVVTEVLQMQTEVEVTRTHRHEGSGQFALPGAVCLQVCCVDHVVGRAPGGRRAVAPECRSARPLLPALSPLLAPQPRAQS